MGTFHTGKHELHGITVVVETESGETFVGRCDDMDDEKVILLDVDIHRPGESTQSKEDYLRKAAQWGVFAKHPHLVVDRKSVTSVSRLGDL